MYGFPKCPLTGLSNQSWNDWPNGTWSLEIGQSMSHFSFLSLASIHFLLGPMTHSFAWSVYSMEIHVVHAIELDKPKKDSLKLKCQSILSTKPCALQFSNGIYVKMLFLYELARGGVWPFIHTSMYGSTAAGKLFQFNLSSLGVCT